MGGVIAKHSPQDMEEVIRFIDESIATKKEGALEWIDIEKRKDCDEIQDYMGKLTGSRTVPRVFIGGKFFGDGTFTAKAKTSGLLERVLREAGAI